MIRDGLGTVSRLKLLNYALPDEGLAGQILCQEIAFDNWSRERQKKTLLSLQEVAKNSDEFTAMCFIRGHINASDETLIKAKSWKRLFSG